MIRLPRESHTDALVLASVRRKKVISQFANKLAACWHGREIGLARRFFPRWRDRGAFSPTRRRSSPQIGLFHHGRRLLAGLLAFGLGRFAIGFVLGQQQLA